MFTNLEIAERRALATALKERRDKDAAQAILDNEARRLAVLEKTARLRAARLAKSTEVPRKGRSNGR
jgi:hypothetical protein